MTPTREQCLKWAEEAGLCTLIATYKGVWQEDAFEALCQRVWNESRNAALEEAIDAVDMNYSAISMVEAIRKLKVTP